MHAIAKPCDITSRVVLLQSYSGAGHKANASQTESMATAVIHTVSGKDHHSDDDAHNDSSEETK